jgi:hypothetical protein
MRSAALIIFCILVTSVPAPAQQSADPSYVRLDASLASTSLAPGDTTELLLRFTPADDIHLNGTPGVEVALDSTVAPAGALRQDVDARTGYLRTGEPLAMRVVLSPGARPGLHRVIATISYFFCSGTEGWCMRKREQVALPLTVRPRTASPTGPG